MPWSKVTFSCAFAAAHPAPLGEFRALQKEVKQIKKALGVSVKPVLFGCQGGTDREIPPECTSWQLLLQKQ